MWGRALQTAARCAATTGLPSTAAAAPAVVSRVLARTFFGQKFEVGRIEATRREATGSRLAQWARQNQLIPGVIYGRDERGRDEVELVYVREGDLRTVVNRRGGTFMNTLFDIVVDGEVVQRVLPRDFQIHPFRPKAIAINWMRYVPGTYPGARIDIPLKAINEERCPGIKEGGWLLELQETLPVYASGAEIPDYLMLDLRGLRVGDKVMASHVELNDGLLLRSKVKDFAIAKILGGRRTADADATAAAGDGKGDKKEAKGGAGDKK